MKAIADYETGPGLQVTTAQATTAIETATRFVEHVAGSMAGNSPGHDAET